MRPRSIYDGRRFQVISRDVGGYIRRSRHIEARLSGAAASRGAPLPFSGVAPGAASCWQSVRSHGVEHQLPSPGAAAGRGRWSRIFLIFVPVLGTMALGKDHAGDRLALTSA